VSARIPKENKQYNLQSIYWLVTAKLEGVQNLPKHHLTVDRRHRVGGQQWVVLVQQVQSRQIQIVRMILKVKSGGAMQLRSNYKKISR
jgi:hypothetical protein